LTSPTRPCSPAQADSLGSDVQKQYTGLAFGTEALRHISFLVWWESAVLRASPTQRPQFGDDQCSTVHALFVCNDQRRLLPDSLFVRTPLSALHATAIEAIQADPARNPKCGILPFHSSFAPFLTLGLHRFFYDHGNMPDCLPHGPPVV
jgi:hypothetical protein